jgi:hypothetical protein
MVVYRITKSKRASDISGFGASLHPGRRMLAGTLLRHEVAELIVLQRQKVFDKTCCSPNSTLPGQLMYGEAIIG